MVGALTREGALARVGAESLRSNELRYVGGRGRRGGPGRGPGLARGRVPAGVRPGAARGLRLVGGGAREPGPGRAGHRGDRRARGGLLLAQEDRAGFARTRRPRGAVDLLPKWDCYTMGYPQDGRARFARADVAARCYDHRGDGRPVVLVEGAAAGTWALGPGERADLQVELFEPAGPALRRAIDERAGEVRALLAG